MAKLRRTLLVLALHICNYFLNPPDALPATLADH